MSETIKFHLVSPERKLAALEANSVTLPGVEGDMTVLPNHSTFLTALRPGILAVDSDQGAQEFIVTGGFAEISDSVATVLAEKSVPKMEVEKSFIEGLIAETEEEVSSLGDNKKASVALRLNDLKILNELIS